MQPLIMLYGAMNDEDGLKWAWRFRLEADEAAEGRGAFLIAYADSKPLECRAIRRSDVGMAQVEPACVVPDARTRGVGRAVSAELNCRLSIISRRFSAVNTGWSSYSQDRHPTKPPERS